MTINIVVRPAQESLGRGDGDVVGDLDAGVGVRNSDTSEADLTP